MNLFNDDDSWLFEEERSPMLSLIEKYMYYNILGKNSALKLTMTMRSYLTC